MSAVLSARSASFVRQGRPIVEAISLDLEPGLITAIAGPNGAGKTTLFRLLSGELQPSSGEILCEGEPVGSIPPWRLACRRAVMTQTARVSFPFTVLEVVRLGVDGIGRAPPAARSRIVERALARADIAHLAGRKFDALSGGEQRRAHFARALAQIEAGATLGGRQALLLDEPVANLDLAHQFWLMDAAREAAERGAAVLAILHDLNLAARYADRLLLIRGGRAAAFGPPAEVLVGPLVSEVFGLDMTIIGGHAPDRPLVLPTRWVGQSS
jgi:iron complex transport system ATP-binding protein